MLAFLLQIPASAQGSTQGLPIENARISPTLYFHNEADELSTRLALHAQIEPLAKEVASSDSASLVRRLDQAWAVMGALQRHGAYLKLQSLENNQDQNVKKAHLGVANDQSLLESAIDNRLEQVPVSEIPSLGPYAFLASQLKSDRKHVLSADEQSYRDSVTLPHEEAIGDAYDRLIDSLAINKGTSSPDLATRRAAIELRDKTYDAAAPAVAAFLASLIDLENRDAVAQGYTNAADRKYESMELNTHGIDQALSAVAAESSVYKSYEQMIAAHAAKKLGVPSILPAEQSLSFVKPQPISLSQGRLLILDALAPLGTDYTKRFSQLLDPANGRLDLSGGSHRAHTGTSISVYDGPVALYYSGYDNSLDSLGVIAHEGGHAIHRELMNANGIPIYEREGPHFLFEGYANLNRLLLLDHAAKIAKTPAEREYALERFLDNFSFDLFGAAEETSFERNLYMASSGNGLLDRPQIDKIYQDSIQPYEYWPMNEVGVSRSWMRKSLLFEDPLYLVNYLYAEFVAVALFDKAKSDPDFAKKYEALLRRGFDADPQTLLLSIGIRLDDPSLVTEAAKLFKSKTEELQSLYAGESH